MNSWKNQQKDEWINEWMERWMNDWLPGWAWFKCEINSIHWIHSPD